MKYTEEILTEFSTPYGYIVRCGEVGVQVGYNVFKNRTNGLREDGEPLGKFYKSSVDGGLEKAKRDLAELTPK